MITFRCTQKARTLLGLGDRDLSDETEGDLYEWFVDLATIDGHRCLLFTHKVTLYSFWALAVRKPDLLRFEEMFRHRAVAMLAADGFDQSEIERLLPAIGHRFADRRAEANHSSGRRKLNRPSILRRNGAEAFTCERFVVSGRRAEFSRESVRRAVRPTTRMSRRVRRRYL
jgi:hypothetical protein